MPRTFVNAMGNFMIQGGLVSFTLQDQAMTAQGGQARAAAPEDVVHVIMREQEFAQLVQLFQTHISAFEEQTGRKLGATGPGPAQAPAKPAASAPAKSGGFKIRPKGS